MAGPVLGKTAGCLGDARIGMASPRPSLEGDRDGKRPGPATAGFNFLPLAAEPPFLARQESLARRPPLRCGPTTSLRVQVRFARRLSSPAKAAKGAAIRRRCLGSGGPGPASTLSGRCANSAVRHFPILAIRLLDAERGGASEREMAEYVLNERARTRRDWLATEHRSRLRRLLAKGHKLLSGGYLQILCPPPRRRRSKVK